MVKHFNVIMAAVISGTVALFTSVLGISGTVIGSVLSTFLYQLLSGYSEERYEERGIIKPNLGGEIVYIFPLAVIAIIELIFVLSALHYRFDMLFDILESAVANNLFRIMGIGLIILGVYPFFNEKYVNKRNGMVVLILGVLLLLRGLVDITSITAKIFYALFYRFDFIFGLLVVVILVLVIINILKGSDIGDFKSKEFVNEHKPKPHARKIDTSFNKFRHSNRNNKHNASNWDDDVPMRDDHYHGRPVYNDEPGWDDDVPMRDDHYHGRPVYNDGHGWDDDVPMRDDHYHDRPVYNNGHDSWHEPYEHVQSNEELPLYEEEVILVKDPENPGTPIKKRILKRVGRNKGSDDDFQDVYIVDELK